MSEFESLAIDMGTSGWKVGRKNVEFYLTSLVTRGPIRERVNGIFEQNYSQDSLDNILVNTDIGKFYVGNIAKLGQAPWSGFGQERYLQEDFMEPMTAASLSEARLTGQNPVVITTAIPAKWEGAKAYYKGQDILLTEAVKSHFGRTHTIDREGQRGQRSISVESVKVLTETQALLYSFLLDKTGQVAVSDYASMRYAVVDIGELTTCIDIFNGMAREGDGITLDDVSMGKVHKITAGQVLDRTGRDFSHWEIRDLVLAGGQIMLPARGNRAAQPFDIMPIYQEALKPFKSALRSYFGDQITRAGDIHYVIVGGGGSEILGDALTDYYRQAQVCGQYATLRGLRNYGERLCAAKNA